MAKLINVGFGNVVNSQKIVAVVSPDAAPVKRMVQSIKGTRALVDATQGRKTKAVIVTSDDYVVLSALQPETIGATSASASNMPLLKVAKLIRLFHPQIRSLDAVIDPLGLTAGKNARAGRRFSRIKGGFVLMLLLVVNAWVTMFVYLAGKSSCLEQNYVGPQ